MDKQSLLFFSAQPSTSSSSTETKAKWHIFVDGASRGNPGKSGAGIYVTDGTQAILKKHYYLGIKTNNQAEYLALLLALFLVRQKVDTDTTARPYLTLTSDSELLIKQMQGKYRVKNPVLKQYNHLALLWSDSFSHRFTHVMRENNTIADALANDGVDKKTTLPVAFVAFCKKNDIPI